MTQTERPSPNHELFVQVLAQIEREPEKWDQSMWSSRTDCGTAYCMAGWAVTLSGYSLLPFSISTDEGHYVPRLATSLLGFTGYRGEYLFDGSNTLYDLYRISADILGIDETVLRDKVAAEVQA